VDQLRETSPVVVHELGGARHLRYELGHIAEAERAAVRDGGRLDEVDQLDRRRRILRQR